MAEAVLRPVLIATPCYGGQACMNYVESILRLPPIVDFHFVKGESLITRARNNCVAYFLSGDWSNLFFIDSDIGFSRDAFERLLTAKYDVVSGIYAKKGDSTGATPGKAAIGPLDQDGFAIAREVPTGFMRIKRHVLEIMEKDGIKPWEFFDTMTEGERYLSEDYAFCRRWQAAGGEVHVDMNADLSHQGAKLYRVVT